MLIEKLDEKADAGDGIDARLGDLVLLGLSQRLWLIFLRCKRQRNEQRGEDGDKSPHGR